MSRLRAPSPEKVWEKKPGVIEVTHAAQTLTREHEFLPKLPPPPSSTAEGAKISPVHDLRIPLPPCAFQPPYYRTSSKKGLWMQDHDPFLAAYKECTKSRKSTENNNTLPKTSIESRLRKSISIFSCKRSCTVRDNNLVRISHLPHNEERD